MGWFGFNGGSALNSNMSSINAVFNTQHAAAASCIIWIAWAFIEYYFFEKKNIHKNEYEDSEDFREEARQNFFSKVIQALSNGLVAGLAGITASSGLVPNGFAIVVGIICGFLSKIFSILIRHFVKKGFDDLLDVTSVHGVSGLIGMLAIGVVCDRTLVIESKGRTDICNSTNNSSSIVWFPEKIIGNQLLVLLIVTIWIIVMMLTILFISDLFCCEMARVLGKSKQDDEDIQYTEMETEIDPEFDKKKNEKSKLNSDRHSEYTEEPILIEQIEEDLD